jgi:hypothetical protein
MSAILWNAVPLYPSPIPDRAFAPHADTTEIEIPPLASDIESPQGQEPAADATVPDSKP